MNTEIVRELLTQYRHDHKAATETLRRERSAGKRAKSDVENLSRALSLVQASAEEIQNHIHQQISKLVSKCLKAVFDDPYNFEIRFVKKRGKTDAQIVFSRNGIEMNAKDGIGGGVLDVASFALRLACISLQNPRPRKLLILDEPFKFVSEKKEYRQRVRLLLETLSSEMGFQIVMVTHDPALTIGKVIEIY